MEAESVGTKRAKVLLLRIIFEKEIKPKNTTRNLNSRLNHPPPVGFLRMRFLALHIIYFIINVINIYGFLVKRPGTPGRSIFKRLRNSTAVFAIVVPLPPTS